MKAPSAPLSSPVTTHYSQFMCSAFILWNTTAAAGFLYCQLIITTVHLWPCRHLSLTFWTFLSLFKTSTSLQGVHPAACSSLELGETFPLDFQINQPPLFFFFPVVVVSLFHGLLIGSSPSFQIQRHAVLLMIIRSAGKTVYHWYLGHCLADELATGTAMKVESICRPLGGEVGSVRPTSHQWRFNPVLSHWEERDFAGVFGVGLLLSHSQGHGSESIERTGASDHCRKSPSYS